MNEVLAKFGYFLRFYERRNKFQYQLRQKLNEKNGMRAELSACVIQKFNEYNLLRVNLKYSENKDLLPNDIVYEPTLNIEKPIECFSLVKFIWPLILITKKLLRTIKKKSTVVFQNNVLIAIIFL